MYYIYSSTALECEREHARKSIYVYVHVYRVFVLADHGVGVVANDQIWPDQREFASAEPRNRSISCSDLTAHNKFMSV